MEYSAEMKKLAKEAAVILVEIAKDAGPEGVRKEEVRKLLEEKGFFRLCGSETWSFFGKIVVTAKNAKCNGGIEVHGNHYVHRCFCEPKRKERAKKKAAVVAAQKPAPTREIHLPLEIVGKDVTITDATGSASFTNVSKVIIIREVPATK